MPYKIEDRYEKAGSTGVDETLVIHRIDTSVYVGTAFYVDWILTGVTNDENGIGAHLQGFFVRFATSDLVSVPADANPVMAHLVGSAPLADADIAGGLVVSSAIAGKNLVLSVSCSGVITDWFSRAVVTGFGA